MGLPKILKKRQKKPDKGPSQPRRVDPNKVRQLKQTVKADESELRSRLNAKTDQKLETFTENKRDVSGDTLVENVKMNVKAIEALSEKIGNFEKEIDDIKFNVDVLFEKCHNINQSLDLILEFLFPENKK